MTVTFTNVTVHIEAQSPRDAYARFCAALGSDAFIDWSTEDAQFETPDGSHQGDVSELWEGRSSE